MLSSRSALCPFTLWRRTSWPSVKSRCSLPFESCQAGNFFDPMSLARIASSQLGVPEEAQCLVEQTGCFAELRRRERAPNVTRINCTSIAVEVSRRLADLGLDRRGTLSGRALGNGESGSCSGSTGLAHFA